MIKNFYAGARSDCGQVIQVVVNGNPLPPRHDLRNHSPDGFNWGYKGSGPAQLALAVLAYEFGDEFAQEHYQEFKNDIISNIDDDDWAFNSRSLMHWIDISGSHMGELSP